jgi:hypothetical protein
MQANVGDCDKCGEDPSPGQEPPLRLVPHVLTTMSLHPQNFICAQPTRARFRHKSNTFFALFTCFKTFDTQPHHLPLNQIQQLEAVVTQQQIAQHLQQAHITAQDVLITVYFQ